MTDQTQNELIELRELLQDMGWNNHAMNPPISQGHYEALYSKNARNWNRMIEIESAITSRLSALQTAHEEDGRKIEQLREALKRTLSALAAWENVVGEQGEAWDAGDESAVLQAEAVLAATASIPAEKGEPNEQK